MRHQLNSGTPALATSHGRPQYQKFTMKYIIQRSSIYCIERRVGGRLTSVESVLARHVLLPAFRHPIILAMNRHINQKYCIIQVLYHLTPAKRHRCRLFVQSRGRRVYASDKIMVGDDPTSGRGGTPALATSTLGPRDQKIAMKYDI